MKPSWREATADDRSEIERLHGLTERALNMTLDLPQHDDSAVAIWMVAECGGCLIGGFYLEKGIEAVGFGTDPRMTVTSREVSHRLLLQTQEMGIRYVHIFVPEIEFSHGLKQLLNRLVRWLAIKVGAVTLPDILEPPLKAAGFRRNMPTARFTADLRQGVKR